MNAPFDRLIIEQQASEEITAGGIIIPDKVKDKHKPRRGKVVEAGPDCRHVSKGDMVMFDTQEACFDGFPGEDGNIVEYVFCHEKDILAYTKG
jgi:co-chaperonin GroES (HSP10)